MRGNRRCSTKQAKVGVGGVFCLLVSVDLALNK